MLAKEVAPGYLNVRDGGLYQNFRSQLQAIAARAQYYPVIYYAQLIKQTLGLLEDPELALEGNLRRVGLGLKGMGYLYQVGRGLLEFELNIDELEAGFACLQEALEGQRIQPKSWYSELLSLQGKMRQSMQEQAPRAYPTPAALQEMVQNIPARCRKRDKLAGKVPKYQQALRFGIAMQLRTLALQVPTPEVRTGSIERLRALAQPAAWGADADVMVGLLDTLALVASQDQPREAEPTTARAALEKLADALGSSLPEHPSGLARLLPRSSSPQDAASRAFRAWLGAETLPSKLQQLRDQAASQTIPSDAERMLRQVKRTLRRTATIESFRAHEIQHLSQLSSYIALAKLSHFVERPSVTQQLRAILDQEGVCIIHGFGGAGKSTLAAHYGYQRKDTQTVRWIPAEDSTKLQRGYEELAQELQLSYQDLAKKLAADPRRYRQKLAKLVYDALAKNKTTTLLILDNAEDASRVADCLLHRPSAVQAIITTRNTQAFEDQYTQIQLAAFSQEEGQAYLQVRFKAMKRPYTDQEIARLLTEVGLVPHKLNLEAGYLKANKLVSTAQYITRLRALKQAGSRQQGKLTLPEVALGLETLGLQGQQLMQYGAYLDADFIPRSLLSCLLAEHDEEELSAIVTDLSRLSLMQVVRNGDQELGLQVHREVQASCREYKGWSAEAGLGSSAAILSQLAAVLASQMPWVESAPDNRWQQGKLYAPHVAKVVSALRTSGAEPSAVVAKLLGCMGQYNKEVARNYPEALEYQKQALEIYQACYKGDHSDVARALSEIGTTLSQLGERQQALEKKKQALAMRQRLLQGQDDPDLAHSLNSVGELLTHLGKHQEALQYKQEALAMRQRLFKNQDHRDVARSLNSVGISLEDLGNPREALDYKRAALEMRQRLSNNQDHAEVAHSLNNVGETLIKLGQAEEGIQYCEKGLAMRKRLFESQDHPYMAQSLNGLGIGLTALEQYKEAADHYKQAVAMALRVFKRAHPQLTNYLHHLIETLPRLEDHALTKELLAASEES